MTTKRRKDPTGILPDRVSVDLTDPDPGDLDAVRELLERNTPAARIERLRIHPELADRANKLDQELEARGGVANPLLLMQISEAETAAVWLAGLPAVMEKKNRLDKKSPFKEYEWREQFATDRTQAEIAAEMGCDIKTVRNWKRAIEKIDRDRQS